jgi:IMP dehydrogenase
MMNTVTEIPMINAMRLLGGMGVHHRYIDDLDILIEAAKYGPIAISESMGRPFIDKLADSIPAPIVKIDVAHGDTFKHLAFAKYCVDAGCVVISGNVATVEGALNYKNVGVNIITAGIGAGSVCSTRIVAGVGVPQLHALKKIRKACPDAFIVSDGGHKNSGDIVKALKYADAVILGRLLAGTSESAAYQNGLTRKNNSEVRYSGMASKEVLQAAGKEVHPEGVSGWVPYQGSVKDVIGELCSGIRAGFAYVGAKNIQEFREKAKFIKVSPSTILENNPRI